MHIRYLAALVCLGENVPAVDGATCVVPGRGPVEDDHVARDLDRSLGGVSAQVGEINAGRASANGIDVGKYRTAGRYPAGKGLPGSVEACDNTLRQRFPALHEWLTLTTLEGKPIETATMLVFCEEGKFKACLNDREGERSFFKASQSFQGLLEALEGCLADGSAEWRSRHGKDRRGK